jgi:hypothetical protein
MIRIALVVTYVIGTVFGVIALDADNSGELAPIWLVVSVLLGVGTGDFRFAPLSFLAVPIAIPFGLPTDTNSDPVFPVWVAAMYLALGSSIFILLGALIRRIVESRLQRRRARRDAGIA